MAERPPAPVDADGDIAVFSTDIYAATTDSTVGGAYPATGCVGCGFGTHDRWLPGRVDLPAEVPIHRDLACAGLLMTWWADELWAQPDPETTPDPNETGAVGAPLTGAYARRAARRAGTTEA